MRGHPALLLHGTCRGTITTAMRTSTYIHRYSFIPSRYQYSMYCCSMLLWFPPTHGIIPKFCRPIKCQHKHDRLSKSSTTPLHFNCSSKVYGFILFFLQAFLSLIPCISLVSWKYCTSKLIYLCLHRLMKEVHPVA